MRWWIWSLNAGSLMSFRLASTLKYAPNTPVSRALAATCKEARGPFTPLPPPQPKRVHPRHCGEEPGRAAVDHAPQRGRRGDGLGTTSALERGKWLLPERVQPEEAREAHGLFSDKLGAWPAPAPQQQSWVSWLMARAIQGPSWGQGDTSAGSQKQTQRTGISGKLQEAANLGLHPALPQALCSRKGGAAVCALWCREAVRPL